MLVPPLLERVDNNSFCTEREHVTFTVDKCDVVETEVSFFETNPVLPVLWVDREFFIGGRVQETGGILLKPDPPLFASEWRSSCGRQNRWIGKVHSFRTWPDRGREVTWGRVSLTGLCCPPVFVCHNGASERLLYLRLGKEESCANYHRDYDNGVSNKNDKPFIETVGKTGCNAQHRKDYNQNVCPLLAQNKAYEEKCFNGDRNE